MIRTFEIDLLANSLGFLTDFIRSVDAMLQSLTVVLAMLVQVHPICLKGVFCILTYNIVQAADSSTVSASALPLIHDAITELARQHWPFFPGVSFTMIAVLVVTSHPWDDHFYTLSRSVP